MCTLTWRICTQGYFVAFSRDERRTRALGLGPRTITRAGVAALAPIDGEAGGSWLCANELGCSLALLNGYRFQVAGASDADVGARPSRGELVLSLSDLPAAEQLEARLGALDLERFRPFELAAFDAHGGTRIASWNGTALDARALTASDRPMVSSSFDDSGARRARAQLYQRMVGADATEQELERFHKSHEPGRGAYSPCMHREEAHSVSFTRVRVGPQWVELLYQPLAPCEDAPVERAALARRALARAVPPQRTPPWNSSKR